MITPLLLGGRKGENTALSCACRLRPDCWIRVYGIIRSAFRFYESLLERNVGTRSVGDPQPLVARILVAFLCQGVNFAISDQHCWCMGQCKEILFGRRPWTIPHQRSRHAPTPSEILGKDTSGPALNIVMKLTPSPASCLVLRPMRSEVAMTYLVRVWVYSVSSRDFSVSSIGEEI